GDAGPLALLGKDVAVADAASLDLDPHGPWSRVGDQALDELKGPAGARDLGNTHRGPEDVHIGLLWCYGSLPFSGPVVYLVSRECRIRARRRFLVLPLGFRATLCTDPDGSSNVSPAL